MPQHLFRFQHEVGGLHVVAVRVMIGDSAPVVCEVQIHHARLNANPVAHDCEQLFQSPAQRFVLPYFIELRERFQQMNVRVHRLVAEGETS